MKVDETHRYLNILDLWSLGYEGSIMLDISRGGPTRHEAEYKDYFLLVLNKRNEKKKMKYF